MARKASSRVGRRSVSPATARPAAAEPGSQVGEDGGTVDDLQDDLPGRVDGGRCCGQWRHSGR